MTHDDAHCDCNLPDIGSAHPPFPNGGVTSGQLLTKLSELRLWLECGFSIVREHLENVPEATACTEEFRKVLYGTLSEVPLLMRYQTTVAVTDMDDTAREMRNLRAAWDKINALFEDQFTSNNCLHARLNLLVIGHRIYAAAFDNHEVREHKNMKRSIFSNLFGAATPDIQIIEMPPPDEAPGKEQEPE